MHEGSRNNETEHNPTPEITPEYDPYSQSVEENTLDRAIEQGGRPVSPPPSTQSDQTGVADDSSVTGSDATNSTQAVQKDQSAISQNDDLPAHDSDVIEKEWVMRAKAIVARTKDDPSQQDKEMTKIKAEYVKKRYNKSIEVSEQ